MYGLPKNLDLSFFVDKRLDQICFCEFVVHFVFEGAVSVTLESAFQHQRKIDVDHHRDGTFQSVPVDHSSLMQLVGRSVVSATGDDEGTLILTFDDGQVLRFIERPVPYESYHIRHGDDRCIV